MTDQLTKACINMKGVLRSLTYLCDLNREASDIIKDTNLTVQFSVREGPAARLIFKDGKCAFEDGKGKATIKLYFSSPGKFNALMDGKGMPTILKGFTKLGFLLKDFGKLTARLEHFLRPDGQTVQDEKFKEISTLLTFYTAFNALPEIGIFDPVGAEVMKKASKGQLLVSIENTAHAVRMMVGKGTMKTIAASDGSPEMQMTFSSLDKAGDVLGGRSDFLTALGLGDVKMSGYIPVMMSVEHLVPMLSAYLK
jgi:hypothetical protein